VRKCGNRQQGGQVRQLRGLLVILLAAALSVLVPAGARAQEQWLTPTLGQLQLRADFRETYYPDERVRQQGTELKIFEERGGLFFPIWQNATDELSFSGSVRYQELDTGNTPAILPGGQVQLPGDLWEIKFGPTYRHKFDNGWIAGLNVTVGSASNQPFHSMDEVTARATAFLRVPQGERNAWIFTLNYSNYSEYFAGLPVPGIDFLYSPNDNFTLVFGFPFTSLEWKPFEKLTVQINYVPVRTVIAKVTYEIFQPLRVWAGFDWDDDWYLRANRTDTGDRLFYYEKRITGGIRFDLRHVGFEVSGGYAFDRFYFEGDKYSERNDNRIDIHSGPFVIGKISLRF
jgi:hypothetical protein